MSTLTQTLTPDDLQSMPDSDRYELVDSQLVEKQLGSKAGHIGRRVIAVLSRYEVEHGGWAMSESSGDTCFRDDPQRLRRPDASYIRPGQLDDIPDGWNTFPPDLAVEVVSPSDTYCDVECEVAKYREVGVRMVWIVNPENSTARIIQQNQRHATFGPGDDLSGGEILPDFRVPVNSLFPSPHGNSR